MPSKSRIICAAIKNNAGDIILGIRHFDAIMHTQIRCNPSRWLVNEQGFVDQYGEFFNRKEAWKIATESNQIIRRCPGDDKELFSENIY